ncbi:hypothetical protein MFUM_810026 [Methylacidiphilum fumariolicum SolV]|uniref:Uncharacterized protein n=2 Tax=Candidatus Methylacidiphilum fumarolicum TaxID=591154 RepID=I0K012_METFB|nr:conserved protein of unknown function [Candidatus Methylacidiphilum fumarolicum]CCG92831.1 hypothetical protein MFUM_810026 [Methylacidiphilum fumariolicum SolV]
MKNFFKKCNVKLVSKREKYFNLITFRHPIVGETPSFRSRRDSAAS